jgi:two-component system response regulator NreC
VGDDRKTSIVVAMGQAIVRQGLAALLSDIPDFQLAGEASDGLEAVQLVERLQPEILIVGLMIPGLSGMEVARRVHPLSPATRVIIVSMYANEAYVLEALSSGASGYVHKEAQAADLVTAVREVIAGRRYLSPPLSENALQSYLERTRDAPLDPYESLTAREREVLDLAAEGGNNKTIAARLSISPRTVEAHRASMMQKLGLRTQTDLVRYALRRGIIPTE